MKWLVTLLAVLTPFATYIFLAAAQPTTAPDVVAKEWVQLVDSGNYKDSWSAAGQPFKDRISQEKWQNAVAPVRVPLGTVSSRTVKEVKYLDTLPGMPDGKYAMVQFNSTFANKTSAVETLSLVLQEGHWFVIGYFVR